MWVDRLLNSKLSALVWPHLYGVYDSQRLLLPMTMAFVMTGMAVRVVVQQSGFCPFPASISNVISEAFPTNYSFARSLHDNHFLSHGLRTAGRR